ncbi:MAG: Methionyl-tRNA formyltransferase [uncultured Campylobacterales bacterium]|uniref:Methionyl-tRNA formyltransferase n=1 Tax=uncultured Campylobacterales bacterium TaxID=352960 RepID=A0A6S6SBQ8_9BACT|nr:MAG: Methionyl-tRNA formyltransferase [uncultured Campylobacterales bacterium]
MKEYKNKFNIHFYFTVGKCDNKKFTKELTQQLYYERSYLCELYENEIEEFFTSNRVKLNYDVDANSREFIKEIISLNPASIINIRGRQKFSKDTVYAFRSKDIPFTNLHPSILPYYRGVVSSFWAMYHKEKDYGVTLHRVNEIYDAGAIIGIKKSALDYSLSVVENMLRLVPLAEELLFEYLDNILCNNESISLEKQDHSISNYYTFPTDYELSSFLNKGLKLVNKERVEILIKELTKQRLL